jgi:hypothetical protein
MGRLRSHTETLAYRLLTRLVANSHCPLQAEFLETGTSRRSPTATSPSFIALRLRAVRALGQLMEAQRKSVGLAKGAVGKPGPGRGKRGVKQTPRFDDPPTLAEAGISKNLAREARKAAAPEEEIERHVEMWRKGERPESRPRKAVADVLVNRLSLLMRGCRPDTCRASMCFAPPRPRSNGEPRRLPRPGVNGATFTCALRRVLPTWPQALVRNVDAGPALDLDARPQG